MPIKSVTSDKDALSLTVIGEYPVRSSASGKRTPTRASWRGSGARKPGPPPSPGTTWRLAAAPSTT